MTETPSQRERLLLIDTCGEVAAVALSQGEEVLYLLELPGRTASARILDTVRTLLGQVGWNLSDLNGIGAVTGPGSFTGVRVGLAAAKGLTEAAELPLATASRLAILADAAGLASGFAVLSAGRGEIYVREQRADGSSRDFLSTSAEFRQIAAQKPVVVAEASISELLAELEPQLRALSLHDALPSMLHCLRTGGSDIASIDAHYVRGEQEIYLRREAAVPAASVR